MTILYDDGQEAIAEESQRILRARASKVRLMSLLEAKGEFDQVFWDTVVEQGWTALAIPESHGGLQLGLVELGIVSMACGAATAGAPFLATCYGAACLLLASENAELCSRWLPGLASGSVLATVAFDEGTRLLPERPSVKFAHHRLSGVKTGVTAGLNAELAVVWADEAGQPALVLAQLEGVDRHAVESFDNSRLSAELQFSDTPAEILLTGPAAREAAVETLARMAVVAAHEQTGGAEEVLRMARDYANSRVAFGQLIGAFQSVKHRIAELYVLVELARANCIRAASRAGQSDFLAAAAAARLSATEAYDTAVRDCIQVHGGLGVTWDFGLHLHQRRARSLAVELGNGFFWEDLLVEELIRSVA